ncbi:MAG: molybdenum cofactor guanylyltransferase [Bacteroidota bacterium]
MVSDCTGVILAGGKSKRMGEDKALLLMDGKPFIQYIKEIMKRIFSEVIIVAEKKKEYEFLNLHIEEDIVKNAGPLGGIYTALTFTSTQWSFIVSCDVPFITKELIEYICNFSSTSEIKIPSFNEKLHPLCGMYSKVCLPVIATQLQQNNFKVQNIFPLLPVEIIPITKELSFFSSQLLYNINTQSEYSGIKNNYFSVDNAT